MRNRKAKDIQAVLARKGFQQSAKSHHLYYSLYVNGKKTGVFTYFSHGPKEYGAALMNQVRKQLKFASTDDAERFFDCPMSEQEYIKLLRDQNVLR